MKQENNNQGITSLVLGLCGLLIFPPILGTLAIIFGAIGLSKNQKYAKAGLILGIIELVGTFLLLVFLFAGIATIF